MDLSDFLLQRKSHTSFEFNEINQAAIEEEELLFEDSLKEYPKAEHATIRERLKYLRSYILHYPEYDGMDFYPSIEAFNHYKWREKKLNKVTFTEKEFFKFKEMQESINALGLSPEQTFEFILYLWHTLQDWIIKGIKESMDDRINRMKAKIDENPEIKIAVDVKVGKNHFKFNNQDFLRAVIENYLNSDLMAGEAVETIYPKKREIDYLLLRTLLTYLPIKHKKQKKGTFSQAERTFGLCVLWLVGSINHKKKDNPLFYCSHLGNATFDKLMRDYSHLDLIPILPSL